MIAQSFVFSSARPFCCIQEHPQYDRNLGNFGARVPHGPFFAGIALPVAASGMQGRDPGLSQLLMGFLDSEAVNMRTHDDKTIILAIRR